MRKYFILVSGQQQGSIDESVLLEGIRNGTYSKSSLVWSEGMEKWQPFETLPIAKALETPPAPPVVPAPVPPAPEAPATPAAPATPVTPATPEAAPEAAPAAPETSKGSDFNAKMNEAKDKAMAIIKEQPWKKFSRKTWFIIGGVGIGLSVTFAVLLAVLVYILMPTSFRSDEDVHKYLDAKVTDIRENNSELGNNVRKRVGDMKDSLNDPTNRFGRRRLVGFFAICNETGGLKYLFEKKGFSNEYADRAYIEASGFGYLKVMKYLEPLCTDKRTTYRNAFASACSTGKLEIVKHLVKNCDVVPEESHLVKLLHLDMEEYESSAEVLSAFGGHKVSAEDVMEDVADVAKFLIKDGDLDVNSSAIQAAVKKSPNTKLKKLVRKD